MVTSLLFTRCRMAMAERTGREGASRVSKTYGTKAEAQADGRRMAQADKVEHLIHNEDGAIGSRNSYGNDPYPPEG